MEQPLKFFLMQNKRKTSRVGVLSSFRKRKMHTNYCINSDQSCTAIKTRRDTLQTRKPLSYDWNFQEFVTKNFLKAVSAKTPKPGTFSLGKCFFFKIGPFIEF